MLTRPDELSDPLLTDALFKGWGIDVTSLEYRAVGFGSHHWSVTDVGGGRWFVTADDLDTKLRSSHDSRKEAFTRLSSALATARSFKDAGADFSAAPIVADDGDIVRRITERFALALYPYIDGRSHSWGDYESIADRLSVLELIVTLHSSSVAASRDAVVDDFLIPHGDELLQALGDLAGPWDCGPFSEPARALLSAHAGDVTRWLATYDRLVEEAQASPDRFVLTHGEPHLANLILTQTGWTLIDWETAKMAPPERDLWMLDSGDGQVIAAYQAATGTQVRVPMLDFYRLSWDLAEVAIYVSEFYAPHSETNDSQESWKNLTLILDL